jgi:glycosyltransferase involved in cell wall biosynthesis
VPPEPPSFDLVVATVDRVEPVQRLFDSLERQTHRRFRVLLADQNEDDRLEPIVAAYAALDVLHLRSSRGLSRARNRALADLTADVVAFPDDDCVYADDLLARVASRLASDRSLQGLTGRVAAADGSASASWETEAAELTRENLWNRAASGAIFIRREVVAAVGAFDEQLGLGSGTSWSSGEEIDYLVRSVRAGARIEYDPSVVVQHDVGTDDSRIGFRDGASVGYLLCKHGYPARTLVHMLVRPIGGVAVSLARGDGARARYYAASLRGRVRGYRGARRAKSSA